MATDKEVKLEQNEFYEPTEADKELTDFVTSHCTKWRDYRDTNFLPDWLEYERIFRGIWEEADKERGSERSRLISPATQQAIETRHAEIMEAMTGTYGDFILMTPRKQGFNLLAWFALAVLLWKLLAVADTRGLLAWLGVLALAIAVAAVLVGRLRARALLVRDD